LADIRDHLFTPEDYDQILAKGALVADEAVMVAEDDQGGSYSYGKEGFPSESPAPRFSPMLPLHSTTTKLGAQPALPKVSRARRSTLLHDLQLLRRRRVINLNTR
jgi:hypothetical protein